MSFDRQSSEPDDFKPRISQIRAAILEAAGQRPISLADMARELSEPLMKVSYHVRVLLRFGALRLVDDRCYEAVAAPPMNGE